MFNVALSSMMRLALCMYRFIFYFMKINFTCFAMKCSYSVPKDPTIPWFIISAIAALYCKCDSQGKLE